MILVFEVANQGKFWKYIHSTHNVKSQHKLLQIAHPKADNTVNVFVLHATAFSVFFKYWPDDGLLRPKLVANNRIIINI
jgi:hypothetical protein